ncbi:microfibril-associated glycoprotein 4 [Astyanax mexicanus]|uniref:microfibril-associated glycoprotein 4 n=1 Tax=Astyanax mexicanus TaxID=7994 RepID=UPI0020CAB34F|nr:microfibril-associated glycoprotein 4 [Astyanax mexicanus]
MFAHMLLVVLVLPLLVSYAPAKSVHIEVLPLDCEDIYNNGSVQSGVYTIYPSGPEDGLQVYCDMGCDEYDSRKDGKWTVIQKRVDGSVNFFRRWVEYKNGFGSPEGEYWLGLENLFLLTYANKYELRVDIEDFEGGSSYAQYNTFSVQPESSNYRLEIGKFVNGGAGDCLYYNNGRDFATFDKDYAGCADAYGGGFWYNYWPCHYANPNGQYKWGAVPNSYTGVMWATWKGYYYSMKTIVMKIRRMSLEELNN